MRAIFATFFVGLSVAAFAIGWIRPWNGIGLHNIACEMAMRVADYGSVWSSDQKKVDEPGCDQRTFECAKCGHEIVRIFRW
jgi:hypothetical protein